ncbi:MFS transporter [Ktedonosporobacter rubrisoli]|uniref:MFS transporter n=1 Tax=Ktedonosporobacter rubrisoli TaxID=2509675 RepID=A0A4P6K2Z1_KTERU|nr:MFS transporter [Ktedonosporobacter rubrisoli]QBD81856.1 MFS transporter [Ktedonosporobacter rubrisoli]
MGQARHGDGFLTVIKKKDFLHLWLAQLISMTVFNASNFALLILIEKATGSTTLVGLAIICFSLPAVILGAPAGVFVDRMNKRRVLWGSNCLRALASLVFVICLFFDRHLLLVPIYLLTLLISAISQFFTPAEGSTIPMLVNEEELSSALSLFNITFMLSQAVGYIVLPSIFLNVAPTFQFLGITIDAFEQLYIIIALLYLVCALLITFIPQTSFKLPTHQPKTGPVTTETLGVIRNVWNETYQGWSFVRRNKQLFLAVVQLSFAGVIIYVLGELATPIVTRLLQLPATAMAFVFAPAGIGLVAGSVIMPRIIGYLGGARAVIIGTAILCFSTLFLPLATVITRALDPHGWNTNPWLLISVALLMLIAGSALDFINIPAQTSIQELTPDWIKGRVLALQLMLYNTCSIPVILFMGGTADTFGVDNVLYLMSACELAFGGWCLYYARKHRTPADNENEDVKNSPETDKISQKPS